MTLRTKGKTLKTLAAAGGMMALVGVSSVLFADSASAHGYVENGRAALCKSGSNTDCGAVVYEPQSLEAPKGFPAAGPADGKLASAGGVFPKLDEQSSSRWSKVNISPGTNTFTWKLSAAHATASWKYYITKDGWNQNAALTRDSFNLTPFCSVPYGGKQPPFTYSDTCNVPAKTGYHVILAVWEVADTANAFYNVIDVNFGGGGGGTTISAPTNLASPAKTETSVSLTWSGVTGASSYEVYRNGSLVGTSASASYTDSGLTAGTTYTYSVVAVASAGKSSQSSPLAVKTSGGASTSYPAWNAATAYTGGSKVSYNGANYEAKWWTQGETPSAASSVWKLIP
ncbi:MULTISPECIES: lytic polysaccharide monooxygenase [Paenibacillus]|uniref:lytic polysaccharide monooxygenase n=1 Tax=Paenibacillus TaxID=44249 RepID=UPI0022B8B8C8|nr:lytic polysaccharide monooxygenase [Paenibacillus caseinilyticus]MCZ8520457.1 lytic polysaccharide monooxygenase [Paenibacillus caseinilyticus]